ncbi:MAG TPA: HlyD family efflux transporter periplasmic adaptor subunit [Caulobacteraceae bacterium]|nr:HlyD family efflux transporter periplasmic adaptor subunit [Caulobacteraceae bacterium]
MPALFRRPIFWLAVLGVITVGGVGLAVVRGAKLPGPGASVAHAATPSGPFVAVAEGKADVEGGVISVAARTSGVIRDVYVQEGDAVTKGEILARQEDDAQRLAAQTAATAVSQAQAAIGQTQVQLATARREYARVEPLAADKIVTGQVVDQDHDAISAAEATLGVQRAAVVAARAKLAEARYALDQTIIRAPVDGRIVRRYANPGYGASTLQVTPMFDVEPAAQHIVRAEVTEGAIAQVAVGQTVRLIAEGDPSKYYVGQVIRRAGVFGARKLQSDDPSQRADERVVEVVVSADAAPFLIGQRVLVKFMR